MISDENRSRTENEIILRSQLLTVDDWVSRLQRLHNFFKFASLELLEVIATDKNALENLDTLLDIFLSENECYLTELDSFLKKSRDLMKSIQDSQN